MTGLLLKYNKVHNDALRHLSKKFNKNILLKWGDLSLFKSFMDILTYSQVFNYLKSLFPFNFVIIGDVFWETGQNICRVCKEMKIPVFFIQHGQWIYIVNKKKLEFYPDYTLLFGDNVQQMCSSWEYAKFSKIIVTGNPRYDNAVSSRLGSYVYFSPPVIEELVHFKPSGKVNNYHLHFTKQLIGLDKEIPLVIQPHYREARACDLYKMFPNAQFADSTLDPLLLIKGASKVLTIRDSTIVLDAIAHHKEVVLIDIPNKEASFFDRDYFKGFALESKDKKHVIHNLTCFNNYKLTNYFKQAKKHIYLGDASSRIMEVVKKGIITHGH